MASPSNDHDTAVGRPENAQCSSNDVLYAQAPGILEAGDTRHRYMRERGNLLLLC
jgi:hypothetical protein